MSDSTRRSIRTGIDALLALIVTLAAIVPLLGLQNPAAVAGVLAAATVAINKTKNALEEAGIIKPYLKHAPSQPTNTVPDVEDGDELDSAAVEDDGAPV